MSFTAPRFERNSYNFSLYTGTAAKKKYKSEANFFVPYAATLLDIVHPLLTARFPKASVVARNERDREAARLMNELLKYTFDTNLFDWTFMNQQKASMLFADAWAKVSWNYADSKTDCVTITPLNSFDVLPHPRKITLDDRWPIFIRAEMTKAEMIAQGWDKDAINSVGTSQLKTENYRKQQLAALGYSYSSDDNSNKQDDLYEVVEMWGKMDLSGNDEPEKMSYMVMVNGEKLVNTNPPKGKGQFESPYDHDKIPLAHLPYGVIPNVLLGESFMDPIVSQQEELNALENMKADNYKRRNNPPLKVRRSGDIDLSTLKFVNAMPWLVNDIDDITEFIVPDLAPSIDNQQGMIKSVMQARTGANDVLLASQDAAIQAGDTATGASIANENTKTRFKPQAKAIDLYIQRIGDLAINLYQDPRMFDRQRAIAVADEEGEYYEEMVRPDDIKGDLQFVVQSASTLAESNEQKLQKYVNLKQLYEGDPTINQEEFDKEIFEAAGMDYNKVKLDSGNMVQEAAMKLKQLVAITRQPGFKSTPTAQQQQVLAQIDKLQQIISAKSGATNTAPTAQSAEPQEVPGVSQGTPQEAPY